MRKAVNQKYEVYCSVLFCCCAVVVTLYMATIRVYLHDVSLMLVRVEGAHRGVGGAPGQHVAHVISLSHKPSQHSASWRQPQLFNDSCICDNQRTVILITIHGSSLNYTVIYDVNAKLRFHADTSRDQA
jgi:hypothetical protein